MKYKGINNVLTVLGGLALLAPGANAAAELLLDDGAGNSVQIIDNGLNDDDPLLGSLSYTSSPGDLGVFNAVVSGAFTKDQLGSADAPSMDLFVRAVSGGPGTLEIKFSDTDFTPGTPVIPAQMAIGGTLAPLGSISYTAYSSSTNTLFEETSLIGGPIGLATNLLGGIYEAGTISLTQVVTITHTGSGTQLSSVDAALEVQPGRLGDYVWVDDNKNGIQDPGEEGLNGVTVNLLDCSGNPVLDPNGNPRTTMTTVGTAGPGYYEFSGLAPGCYRVEFILPPGYLFTDPNQGTDDIDSDADPGTGQTGDITLDDTNNFQDFTNDAGLFKPASLGNFVWYDSNGDGIQDDGELGVEGVTVTLSDAAGNPVVDVNGDPVLPITTGADGKYLFTGLNPGEYKVTFSDLPTGFDFTLLDVGGNIGSADEVDSDADPNAGPGYGMTIPVTLISGEENLTLDAGVVGLLGTIGNYVWVDGNGNGIQDPTEQGRNGVTVDLYNCDDPNNPPVFVASAVTMNDGFGNPGFYQFTDLPAGCYIVVFTPPPGFDFTTPGVGDPATDSNAGPSGQTGQIILGPGEMNDTIDAGLIPERASLGDYVWLDLDGDGIQDDFEPGLNGVTVNLLDCNGDPVLDSGGSPLTTVTADDTGGSPGYYNFTDLLPGCYVVEFELPDGYAFTTPNAGPDDVDSDAVPNSPSTGQTGPIDLSPLENDTTNDAGLLSPGEIGNFVWHDFNRDGIQDAFEPGIPNVLLVLSIDLDKDGTVDYLLTTTTNSLGIYLFVNLPLNANFCVEVDPSNFLAGGPLANYVASPTGQGGNPALDSNSSPACTMLTNAAREDLTIDFGYNSECDDCQGGVTQLTLEYLGLPVLGKTGGSLRDAQVKVVQVDNGNVLFDGQLMPGDSFTFQGSGADFSMGDQICLLITPTPAPDGGGDDDHGDSDDDDGDHNDGDDDDGADHDDDDGKDKDGYYRAGSRDKKGRDRDGYDKKGRDKKGYDREGYDKRGYDKKGRRKSGSYDDGDKDDDDHDDGGDNDDDHGDNDDGDDDDGDDDDGGTGDPGTPETYVIKIDTSCAEPIGPGLAFAVELTGKGDHDEDCYKIEFQDGVKSWSSTINGTVTVKAGTTSETYEVQVGDVVTHSTGKDLSNIVVCPDGDHDGGHGGSGVYANAVVVSEGLSLLGGVLCPICDACEGGVTTLTFQNPGPDARIKVVQLDDGAVVFDDDVASGGQFTIVGTGSGNALGSQICITITTEGSGDDGDHDDDDGDHDNDDGDHDGDDDDSDSHHSWSSSDGDDDDGDGDHDDGTKDNDDDGDDDDGDNDDGDHDDDDGGSSSNSKSISVKLDTSCATAIGPELILVAGGSHSSSGSDDDGDHHDGDDDDGDHGDGDDDDGDHDDDGDGGDHDDDGKGGGNALLIIIDGASQGGFLCPVEGTLELAPCGGGHTGGGGHDCDRDDDDDHDDDDDDGDDDDGHDGDDDDGHDGDDDDGDHDDDD